MLLFPSPVTQRCTYSSSPSYSRSLAACSFINGIKLRTEHLRTVHDKPLRNVRNCSIRGRNREGFSSGNNPDPRETGAERQGIPLQKAPLYKECQKGPTPPKLSPNPLGTRITLGYSPREAHKPPKRCKTEHKTPFRHKPRG